MTYSFIKSLYLILLTLHTFTAKSNLCSVKNGGCDHIYTPNLIDRIRMCTCRPGYSLAQDGHSCFGEKIKHLAFTTRLSIYVDAWL